MIEIGGVFVAAALSPDGRDVAVASRKLFYPDGLYVHRLDAPPGLRLLRGMTEPIGLFKLSPSSRLLAAVEREYRVGVWELKTGRLASCERAPEGLLSLSVTLAVSPDDRLLALCGGRDAQVWDLETGRTLQTWRIPPGTFELMEFDRTGRRLLLLRVEARDGSREPFNNHDLKNPNVFKPARPAKRQAAGSHQGHRSIQGRWSRRC